MVFQGTPPDRLTPEPLVLFCFLLFVSQKMEGVAPEPIWEEYCFREGVVDAKHLQLVALERVSQSSWMLHLRLIPPTPPPQS